MISNTNILFIFTSLFCFCATFSLVQEIKNLKETIDRNEEFIKKIVFIVENKN